MASLTFEITAGDTLPPVRGVLIDADNVVVPIQVGDTVRFRMRPVVPGLTADLDGLAVVNDADAGDVEYQWQPTDTDVPGVYQAEFHLVPPGGVGGMTFPNDDYITVVIKPKAATPV